MQRIESGRLGGRHLLRLPKGVDGLRPTAARVRGAVFDRIGSEIRGARILDLFGGSGAMSIEGISRGAEHATIVERSGKVVRHLQAQVEALELGGQVQLVKADAAAFVRRDPRPFDLVIIDPPFAMPEVVDALAGQLTAGWLAAEAIVVCERELVRGKSRDVAWPGSLEPEVTKQYGQAVVEFLRFHPESESSNLP